MKKCINYKLTKLIRTKEKIFVSEEKSLVGSTPGFGARYKLGIIIFVDNWAEFEPKPFLRPENIKLKPHQQVGHV